MTTYAWNAEFLKACREMGDPLGDAMALEILSGQPFGPRQGRLGYNHLLDLVDRLMEAPELYLVEDSQLRREFAAMPPAYDDFFDPMPVPEWVDPAKLARASELWDENMLAIIGVLYAASLPSCYLIARGIPALYATGKLKDHRFIYQRIYETGLMLDAVMDRGGLHIVSDDPPPSVAGAVAVPGRRFVWGRGFLAARKVRLLHASMRMMLLDPTLVPTHAGFANTSAAALTDRSGDAKPYDRERFGLPINQEDLAYTLMTFAQVIPAGLETWGCRLCAADRDAFIHTWRLVGFIMGLDERLLPVDWAAACDLIETVRRDQGGASDIGRRLTRSLERFLADYLPPRLKPTLPAMLIRSQLGAKATDILPVTTHKPGLLLRVVFALSMFLVRCYFLAKRMLLDRLPLADEILAGSFRTAGGALVDSWRDDYERRPFWIPDNVDEWVRDPDINAAYLRKLHAWRSRLFNRVLLGLTMVILGSIGLCAALTLLFCLPGQQLPSYVGGASGLLLFVGTAVLRVGIPRLAAERLRLQPARRGTG